MTLERSLCYMFRQRLYNLDRVLTARQRSAIEYLVLCRLFEVLGQLKMRTSTPELQPYEPHQTAF